MPAHPSAEPAIVFASAEGFAAEAAPSGRLDALARAGRHVLALDLRGTGETRQDNQPGASAAIGHDWQDVYRAYLLGRPYVGMQTEDLLLAVRAARERTHQTQVDLLAIGGVGVPALHAAFAEPALFRQVTTERALRAWDEVTRAPRFYQQFMNAVPGALLVYDLPDLAIALGDRLTLIEPTDPLGWTAKEVSATVEPANLAPDRPGLCGVFYGNPRFVNPQRSDLLRTGSVNWSESRLKLGRDRAVRWRGFLIPDITGDITLGVESNVAASLQLAGRDGARTESNGSPTAGPTHCETGTPLIEIDFVKPGPTGSAAGDITTLRLQWRQAGGLWQPVPDSWLHHSRQQEFEIEHQFR